MYYILNREKINGVEIIFEKKYQEEKIIIKENYNRLSNLLNDLWGLNKPENINIFITNSYIKYSIYAYSLIQKIILLIILPYWLIQIKRTSKDIGAIGFNAKVPSILIKSLPVLELIESNIGKLIYKKIKNNHERYKHGYIGLLIGIRIYELKCPKWLGSGIGSMTSEKFLSRDIVKKETINMLAPGYRDKDLNNLDNAYPHVIGYWTVRYLEENYPGFLKETFKKHKGEEIVGQISKKLGLNTDDKEELWTQLDELLYDHYRYLLEE